MAIGVRDSANFLQKFLRFYGRMRVGSVISLAAQCRYNVAGGPYCKTQEGSKEATSSDGWGLLKIKSAEAVGKEWSEDLCE